MYTIYTIYTLTVFKYHVKYRLNLPAFDYNTQSKVTGTKSLVISLNQFGTLKMQCTLIYKSINYFIFIIGNVKLHTITNSPVRNVVTTI